MSSISSNLSWKKDYIAYTKDEHFVVRRLNFFQRCVRALGFYRNTHLAKVGAVAQKTCFQPGKNRDNEEKELILTAISKANSKEQLNMSLLGEAQLETGETARFEGMIVVNKGYYFTVQIIDSKKPMRKAVIYLHLNIKKNNRLDIDNLYEHGFPTYKDFMTNKDDLLARVSYSFLSKLVCDSQKITGLDMAHTHRTSGALLALEYGFTGPVNEPLMINGQDVGSPHELKLEKSEAKKFASTCPLKEPVAVDFLQPA